MTGVCIALACCLLLSVSLNFAFLRVMYKEHRDACTRLMCKSAGEYKVMTDNVIREPVETAHQKALREWREKGKR